MGEPPAWTYGVGVRSRAATAADVDAVTETVRLAFLDDPTWAPALAGVEGRTDHLGPYWRFYVEGALRYGTVRLVGHADAVAVWIPPDGVELSPDQEEGIEALVRSSLAPDRAAALFELWERFATARPTDRPHAYLSLLATHPDHRGRGIGQQLLAEGIAEWDAEGVPSYLESSNPANDHRYQRAGYERIGRFTSVLDDAPVTTMWRPAARS